MSISCAQERQQLAKKLASLDDIEAQQDELVALVGSVVDVGYLGLYCYDTKREKLLLRCAKGLNERERRIAELTAMQRSPGEAFRQRQPISVPASAATNLHQYFIPVVARDTCLAVLALAHREAFSLEQIETLQWLAKRLLRLFLSRAEIPLVLVAEDNKVNQVLAERLLEKQGCHVCLVENGRLAVEAVQEQCFDLILLDLQMPEFGGYEAMRQIRASLICPETPIVALTAASEEEERAKCLDAGFDEHISKPLHVDTVASLLTRFVKKCTGRRANPAEKSLHGELLRVAQEHWPTQKAALLHALQSQDYTLLTSAAHSLRGLVGFWAGEPLMQKLARIERQANAKQPIAIEIARLLGLLNEFDAILEEKIAQTQLD